MKSKSGSKTCQCTATDMSKAQDIKRDKNIRVLDVDSSMS